MRYLLFHAHLHDEGVDRAVVTINLVILVVVMGLCAWKLLVGY